MVTFTDMKWNIKLFKSNISLNFFLFKSMQVIYSFLTFWHFGLVFSTKGSMWVLLVQTFSYSVMGSQITRTTHFWHNYTNKQGDGVTLWHCDAAKVFSIQ